MTPFTPYLIRATHEWIVNNSMVPLIIVDAHVDFVEVPPEQINDQGKIILNINPMAVKDLVIDDDSVTFATRFNGISHHIYIPTTAVMGIYSRETGQGMIFNPDNDNPPNIPTPTPPSGTNDGGKPKPKLKIY